MKNKIYQFIIIDNLYIYKTYINAKIYRYIYALMA